MGYKIGIEMYRIAICDHILDNIYGQIGLTEVEQKLERLPIFKRLHNISQLGLVNLIFPCALHTRYTHSLGVMHVAGEMAQRINSNMQHDFFDDSDIQIIRLAGMLHDIGHYPMSHNVEAAYRDSQELDTYNTEYVSSHLDFYTNCPGFLHPDSKKRGRKKNDNGDSKLKAAEKFAYSISGSDGFHHENIGCTIISKNREIHNVVRDNFVLLPVENELVLNPKFRVMKYGDAPFEIVTKEQADEITSKLLGAIGEMVRGNYENIVDEKYPWLKKYSAMIQIIHSDIDADNFDYLIRDATFSGTSYGTMDMSVLLNCLTVSSLEDEKQGKKKYIIGVKRKGLGSVEQFLVGKFQAYSQMILTKYVSIVEAMLQKLETKYIIPRDKNYSSEKLLNLVKSEHSEVKYLAFTDDYIHQEIFKWEETKDGLALLPRAIVTHLANMSAMELAKVDDPECICTGLQEGDICNEIKASKVYKRFLRVYEVAKDKVGAEIDKTDLDAQLSAFRFETYSLTKQIPIKQFLERFDFIRMSPVRCFNFFYYRLGSGIPVIEKERYFYQVNEDGNIQVNELPCLCVDVPQSSLKDLWSMKFVSLRQYDMREYSA
ncbi:MAG: HD domain-containing protein [Lachnospiraceae bacterium]|nr:HD domain-containing protein [Lachnospiraceae bacterium]MBD5512805.1 HD domain-containing protein [Lachnospiraceae bacterium]